MAFLVKMLNHEVENFRFIARESLKLDMMKRGVQLTTSENNFLGYEVNERGFLRTNTTYGCQSDWPELVRYARKLNVMITFVDDLATVYANGIALSPNNLQKQLMRLCNERDVQDAMELSIQNQFLNMTNINRKSSNSIFYNWKVDDDLVRFVAKARLSILPTRFTTYIWNRENNPLCPFGCRKTESVAHVFNGCIGTFGNFYSRRHDRIVSLVADMLKSCCRRVRVMAEKNVETVFPLLKDETKDLDHRRPDIFVVDELSKRCRIVEVTVCFDMYLDIARESKMVRYSPLVECLKNNGYNTEMFVLCFGSLGTVHKDVWSNLRKFSSDRDALKGVVRDCSISAIIGSNYIWRHRVKKLLS